MYSVDYHLKNMFPHRSSCIHLYWNNMWQVLAQHLEICWGKPSGNYMLHKVYVGNLSPGGFSRQRYLFFWSNDGSPHPATENWWLKHISVSELSERSVKSLRLRVESFKFNSDHMSTVEPWSEKMVTKQAHREKTTTLWSTLEALVVTRSQPHDSFLYEHVRPGMLKTIEKPGRWKWWSVSRKFAVAQLQPLQGAELCHGAGIVTKVGSLGNGQKKWRDTVAKWLKWWSIGFPKNTVILMLEWRHQWQTLCSVPVAGSSEWLWREVQ